MSNTGTIVFLGTSAAMAVAFLTAGSMTMSAVTKSADAAANMIAPSAPPSPPWAPPAPPLPPPPSPPPPLPPPSEIARRALDLQTAAQPRAAVRPLESGEVEALRAVAKSLVRDRR